MFDISLQHIRRTVRLLVDYKIYTKYIKIARIYTQKVKKMLRKTRLRKKNNYKSVTYKLEKCRAKGPILYHAKINCCKIFTLSETFLNVKQLSMIQNVTSTIIYTNIHKGKSSIFSYKFIHCFVMILKRTSKFTPS